MAGRGRGRGRGRTFNVEALGLESAEAMPPPVLQPPPTFPELEFKPVTLEETEDLNYCLSFMQDYMKAMKESSYYIKPSVVKRDIERYSDKYSVNKSSSTLNIDWNRVPKELLPTIKKVKKPVAKPNTRNTKIIGSKMIEEKFQELEKKETNADEEHTETEKTEEKGEDEEDEDRDIEDETFYDEEEEEETDYVLSYFDNGEMYGDDDEDNLDDGPIY